MDDRDAVKSKGWRDAFALPGFVGTGYVYARESDAATIRFPVKVLSSGRYETRIAYQPHLNRGSTVPVIVEHGDESSSTTVNMKQPSREDGFHSIGQFEFSEGQTIVVQLSSEGAGGDVHADYTPVLHTSPGPTAWAHQLAMLVVTDSPLQTYAEHPATMMRAPIIRDSVDVMRAIPRVWDETIILPGSEIGQLVAFARRVGDDWFVGVVNDPQELHFHLNYSFLPAEQYTVKISGDDLEAEPVNVADIGVNTKAKRKQWTTTTPLRVTYETIEQSDSQTRSLAGGSGFIIHLIKNP